MLNKGRKSKFFISYGFWHGGEGFHTLLIVWYMTFSLNLSPSEIGLFQSLYLFPNLVFILFGGVITDAIGAYRTYFISTIVFVLLLLLFPAYISFYGHNAIVLSIYCVVAGLVTAVSNPAIDTFILGSNLAETENNSVSSASIHYLGKLFGTTLGLLLPILSAVLGFMLNGILFLLSVLFLSAHNRSIDIENKFSKPRICKINGLGSTIVSHFSKNSFSLDFIIASALLGMVVVPTGTVIWPLIIREKLPMSADLIAWVYASFWVGMILSTSYARIVIKILSRSGYAVIVLWMLTGFSILLLFFIETFFDLLFFTLLEGLFLGAGKPLVYGRYLESSPKNYKGLFIAVDQMAFWGLATLGSIVIGMLIDTLNVDTAIICSSFFLMIGVAVIGLRGNLTSMDNLFKKNTP